jgi:ORF6N domain
MLDSDLADLYQVTTGNLNLAVKRNLARFPADFMFRSRLRPYPTPAITCDPQCGTRFRF